MKKILSVLLALILTLSALSLTASAYLDNKTEPFIDKIEETKEEFNKIIDWIEMLNEVDTDGVAPLVSVNDSNLLLREDIVMEGNQAGAVLKNAPQSQYGYFTVPKVVE